MSALESLYEWFKEQLSRTYEPGGEPGGDGGRPDVVNTQKAFVNKQLGAILSELGVPPSVHSRIVTVRKRFCEIHRYLRPVYAEPPDLNPYLTQAGQQTPFNVEFGDNDDDVFGSIPSNLRIRTEDAFLCIHRVGDDINGRPTEDAETIAERLTRFWQNNLMGAGSGDQPDGYDFAKRVDKLNDLKRGQGKALFCIFAGSRGPSEDGSKSELKALFGAYLVRKEGWTPSSKALGRAFIHAGDLFRGLEVISQLDSRHFELQGLRRMAKLLPDFVNEDIPRSDKISAALSTLKEQLNQHLVGRPEWEGGEEPKLFYLSASFERVRHGWFPRLEVYPHSYRDAFPLVSLLVSHAGVPSASKFLLKTYLDRHREELPMGRGGVMLDPAFSDLFKPEDLAVPELDTWQHRVIRGDDSTCLHMVEQDEEIARLATGGKLTPWEVLNHSVDSGGVPSRSLLAFVIEGEKRPDVRAFPRGILALESSAIDAFSDQDIGALGEVVRAFGSLVRLITHDNACLEYRTKLSEAFHAELRDNLPDEAEAAARLRKFVFSVKKIDGQQFHRLLNDAIPHSRDSGRVWELLKLKPEDVTTLEGFREHIDSRSDEEVTDQVTANQIVADRVEWAIGEVQDLFDNEELVGDLNEHVVEFLFACTENFQWSAYLSSMAQALGDRAMKAVPEFEMMTPGYSASRMFMASVTQELRQVVKLSEYSKLSKERENYKTYVRYRLVNSARMPVNGFAFDGIGWHDPDNKVITKEKFGALVSDLISAERNETDPIKTFVTLLCECIDGDFDPDLHMQILHSIRGLFEHGTALWQEEIAEDAGLRPENFNIGAYIREVSRLPRSKGRTDRRDDLDRAISIYADTYKDHSIPKKMVDLLFMVPETIPTNREFLNTLYQISHRDLNSRNLTWSSALTTFLMIDFEHVGRGFLGHDQTRLWVNAICDLYNEARHDRVMDTRIDNILSETDNLIDKTNDFLTYLADCTKRDGKSISKYVSRFFPAHAISKGVVDFGKIDNEETGYLNYFTTFFISLFLNFGDVKGMSGLIVYCFYCNALKEFEYSSREISQERLESVLCNLGKFGDLKSADIHKALFDEESFTIPLQGLYFRHFTAGRLLRIAYDALNRLKIRERRGR